MGARGTFDIPTWRGQSCNGARKYYRDAYNEEWSGDNNYLRQLAKEFRDQSPNGSCNEFIIRMREFS
jgi:hypothetical protein